MAAWGERVGSLRLLKYIYYLSMCFLFFFLSLFAKYKCTETSHLYLLNYID